MPLNIWLRFVCYGLAGWCFEIAFTAIKHFVRSRFRDWSLAGKSFLWMFPIYGLAAFLFEPLHNALRNDAWPLRGLIYIAGLYLVEYSCGWTLRALIGKCPWDYSHARHQFQGLIRWDYAPVWFGLGLALEWLHDLLLRIRIQ